MPWWYYWLLVLLREIESIHLYTTNYIVNLFAKKWYKSTDVEIDLNLLGPPVQQGRTWLLHSLNKRWFLDLRLLYFHRPSGDNLCPFWYFHHINVCKGINWVNPLALSKIQETYHLGHTTFSQAWTPIKIDETGTKKCQFQTRRLI